MKYGHDPAGMRMNGADCADMGRNAKQEEIVMLAQQRYKTILDLLEEHGIVHSADLVREMKVSSETVRKDLISYAASKPVRCRRGGIVYSQLKGGHGAASRDKSLRAVILGAPISKAKAQEIQHQIRLCSGPGRRTANLFLFRRRKIPPLRKAYSLRPPPAALRKNAPVCPEALRRMGSCSASDGDDRSRRRA